MIELQGDKEGGLYLRITFETDVYSPANHRKTQYNADRFDRFTSTPEVKDVNKQGYIGVRAGLFVVFIAVELTFKTLLAVCP
jgi:hypothetical protein